MLVKLSGGSVYDPANSIDGVVQDIYLRDGRVVDRGALAGEQPREVHDLHGLVVMAGAIDLHTHIGGGKVNIARAMLPELPRADSGKREAHTRAGSAMAAPSTRAAGYRYAEMGYTACFEPAVLPVNARQAHMELADTPMVDTGGYALLGNDDFLLRMLAENAPQSLINDYVAWTLNATQCIGIKTVNPGGISAFKFNRRKLDVDEASPHYGVRPRDIVRVLCRALHELGVAHPLHVHASNLGVAGNYASTLATMDASEGYPIHLTHIQFHSYGSDGSYGFSSRAHEIAEAVNRHPHISADVGQIMFGQTVTASADTMAQYKHRGHASPAKWTCMDIECEAGCGIVPFRYRSKRFVNALQWAIGLELFLLIDDPWRVFLTTDHPNGAPFTSYPHLIRLLCDRGFRNDMLESLHPKARKMSQLESLEREYSLYEIAIMTRAAPARILGLADQGHLAPGARGNICVYAPHQNRERMFEKPRLVMKDGEVVVRDGIVTKVVNGNTHVVHPEYDPGIEKALKAYFDDYHTIRFANFKISADEMAQGIGSPVEVHPCRADRST